MTNIFKAILKNNTAMAISTAVLTFIAYYFGMWLMTASKFVMIASVVGGLLSVAFNTYAIIISRVNNFMHDFTKLYLFTIIVTVATMTVVMVAPSLIPAFSFMISLVLTAAMMKYSLPTLREVYAD